MTMLFFILVLSAFCILFTSIGTWLEDRERLPVTELALFGGLALAVAWLGVMLRWLFMKDVTQKEVRRRLTLSETLAVYLMMGTSMGLFFTIHWKGHGYLGFPLMLLPFITAAFLDRPLKTSQAQGERPAA